MAGTVVPAIYKVRTCFNSHTWVTLPFHDNRLEVSWMKILRGFKTWVGEKFCLIQVKLLIRCFAYTYNTRQFELGRTKSKILRTFTMDYKHWISCTPCLTQRLGMIHHFKKQTFKWIVEWAVKVDSVSIWKCLSWRIRHGTVLRCVRHCVFFVPWNLKRGQRFRKEDH